MPDWRVSCAECGAELNERPDDPEQARRPCPQCNSLARAVDVVSTDVVIGPASAPLIALQATASLDFGLHAVLDVASVVVTPVPTTSMGLQVQHECTVVFAPLDDDKPLEGGCHVEVRNVRGNVVVSGVGVNYTDALLGVIAYLLPPGHHEYPKDELPE